MSMPAVRVTKTHLSQPRNRSRNAFVAPLKNNDFYNAIPSVGTLDLYLGDFRRVRKEIKHAYVIGSSVAFEGIGYLFTSNFIYQRWPCLSEMIEVGQPSPSSSN